VIEHVVLIALLVLICLVMAWFWWLASSFWR